MILIVGMICLTVLVLASLVFALVIMRGLGGADSVEVGAINKTDLGPYGNALLAERRDIPFVGSLTDSRKLELEERRRIIERTRSDFVGQIDSYIEAVRVPAIAKVTECDAALLLLSKEEKGLKEP